MSELINASLESGSLKQAIEQQIEDGKLSPATVKRYLSQSRDFQKALVKILPALKGEAIEVSLKLMRSSEYDSIKRSVAEMLLKMDIEDGSLASTSPEVEVNISTIVNDLSASPIGQKLLDHIAEKQSVDVTPDSE